MVDVGGWRGSGASGLNATHGASIPFDKDHVYPYLVSLLGNRLLFDLGPVHCYLGRSVVVHNLDLTIAQGIVINDSIGQAAASTYQKAVIRIVTIEREYGCGAAGIARELAARLGWKLWDQLLTQEIARFAHCEQSEVKRREERRDPLYYRLLKSFTLGSYEGNSSVCPVETLDADSIVRISKQVVEEAASGGDCVIVGRGSQHFLQDRDDTLRFFLYGSKKLKIQRLISEGQEEIHAQVLVETVDSERAAFIRNYFHADWPNRSLYHAMVNTDAGGEAAIHVILSFLQGFDKGSGKLHSEAVQQQLVTKRVANP